MAEERVVDEVLEFIWSQRELGNRSIRQLIRIDEVARANADMTTLEEMEKTGLVTLEGDTVYLTPMGEKLAQAVIRRHRLAERLLTEVLAVDEQSIEKEACTFEHTLSPEVTDSICTLLGHPPTCPHGLPIPQGECCRKTGDEMKPLVQPLDRLGPGEMGRIIFIVSGIHTRLDKLSALGIVPGSTIRVHQKRPAYVIQIGETTLALDPEIIREIYVKKV